MIARRPPQNKKPDLGLFMCVLRPHARFMMGAGTRIKIKGEMNTQKNKTQVKPLSLLPKARSKDRKEDDSETAKVRQNPEAVGGGGWVERHLP